MISCAIWELYRLSTRFFTKYILIIDYTSHQLTGVYHEWKANSTGRSAQTVREFLEKNYTSEIAAKDDQVIKLAIQALLEVVQGKNLEVAIMRHNTPMKLLSTSEVDAIVTEIEREKEEMTQ